MDDQQKTKKQLLEELQQERSLVKCERERSMALKEVSNKVAAAHDTDEVLDLIVNEAARLLGAPAAWLRFLDGNVMIPGATTKSGAAYIEEHSRIRPTLPRNEHCGTLSGSR